MSTSRVLHPEPPAPVFRALSTHYFNAKKRDQEASSADELLSKVIQLRANSIVEQRAFASLELAKLRHRTHGPACPSTATDRHEISENDSGSPDGEDECEVIDVQRSSVLARMVGVAQASSRPLRRTSSGSSTSSNDALADVCATEQQNCLPGAPVRTVRAVQHDSFIGRRASSGYLSLASAGGDTRLRPISMPQQMVLAGSRRPSTQTGESAQLPAMGGPIRPTPVSVVRRADELLSAMRGLGISPATLSGACSSPLPDILPSPASDCASRAGSDMDSNPELDSGVDLTTTWREHRSNLSARRPSTGSLLAARPDWRRVPRAAKSGLVGVGSDAALEPSPLSLRSSQGSIPYIASVGSRAVTGGGYSSGASRLGAGQRASSKVLCTHDAKAVVEEPIVQRLTSPGSVMADQGARPSSSHGSSLVGRMRSAMAGFVRRS